MVFELHSNLSRETINKTVHNLYRQNCGGSSLFTKSQLLHHFHDLFITISPPYSNNIKDLSQREKIRTEKVKHTYKYTRHNSRQLHECTLRRIVHCTGTGAGHSGHAGQARHTRHAGSEAGHAGHRVIAADELCRRLSVLVQLKSMRKSVNVTNSHLHITNTLSLLPSACWPTLS